MRAADGWVYLAVVVDAYSRLAVGWSIADHLRAGLVCGEEASATAHSPTRPRKRGNSTLPFVEVDGRNTGRLDQATAL